MEQESLIIKVPVEMRDNFYKVVDQVKKQYREKGIYPSMNELAMAVDLDEEEVRNIIKEVLSINNIIDE